MSRLLIDLFTQLCVACQLHV